MAKFNTENLKKVVSLGLIQHVAVGSVKVVTRRAKGVDPWQVGIVPLKVKGDKALSVYRLIEFRNLARTVFDSDISGHTLSVDVTYNKGGVELIVYPA